MQPCFSRSVLFVGLAAVLACGATPAPAADLPGGPYRAGKDWRDGADRLSDNPDADGRGLGAWRRRQMLGGRYAVECPDGPWRPPYGLIVPTNAPCDPTYVGSSFGLNRPSAYGTLPPPGEGAP